VTATRTRIRIFISHSSADRALAEALTNLLTRALEIDPEEIRCSSVPGHNVDPGTRTSEALRSEISKTDAFIGLLTRSSLQSTYVLFEIGARWGAKGWLAPVIGPDLRAEDLKPPLSELNVARSDDATAMAHLVESIAETLQVPARQLRFFQAELTKVTAITASAPSSQDPVPPPPLPSSGTTAGHYHVHIRDRRQPNPMDHYVFNQTVRNTHAIRAKFLGLQDISLGGVRFSRGDVDKDFVRLRVCWSEQPTQTPTVSLGASWNARAPLWDDVTWEWMQ
jgi:hypothetical protein